MQVESISTCSVTFYKTPPVSSATIRLTPTTERPVLPLPTCILRPTPDTAGILALSIPITAATSPVKNPFLLLGAGLNVSCESRLANRVVSTAYLPIPPPYVRTQRGSTFSAQINVGIRRRYATPIFRSNIIDDIVLHLSHFVLRGQGYPSTYSFTGLFTLEYFLQVHTTTGKKQFGQSSANSSRKNAGLHETLCGGEGMLLNVHATVNEFSAKALVFFAPDCRPPSSLFY
ncbi:hypothetical protein GYMLUDRAFT_253282 [Collybiopsis luxurians FD-317 M1]|uniref:Uncharacterized protein n=1 Tax=Collybiopsis luxurians FD-317 M1 TaxID=944289 RepID=A0A0D0B7N1_9AGAR|nr:hypothetical protein GYMLUDRAFT_253282 [Collybiopsis luxurians FD-317 M1]